MCPPTTLYMHRPFFWKHGGVPHIFVLILLYICPQTTVYVSSYYYIYVYSMLLYICIYIHINIYIYTLCIYRQFYRKHGGRAAYGCSGRLVAGKMSCCRPIYIKAYEGSLRLVAGIRAYEGFFKSCCRYKGRNKALY